MTSPIRTIAALCTALAAGAAWSGEIVQGDKGTYQTYEARDFRMMPSETAEFAMFETNRPAPQSEWGDWSDLQGPLYDRAYERFPYGASDYESE